jgi:hypothetical protein
MKSITLLTAGLVLALNANAGVITSSFTNALEPTDIHQSGQLSLFDSSLGVLTGISFSFSGRSDTEFVVNNNSSTPQSALITAATTLSFHSDLAALNNLMSGANGQLILSNDRIVNLAGFGDDYIFGLSATQGQTWGNQFNAILASFTQNGGGSFGLSCDSVDSLSVNGGDGHVVVSERISNAACDASIRYTYTAGEAGNIPEPNSLALLALALGGAGWVRGRAQALRKV